MENHIKRLLYLYEYNNKKNNSIIKEEVDLFLNESYEFNSLSIDEKSLGTSWTKEKFFNRVKNWLFFGDMKLDPKNLVFINWLVLVVI